MSNNARDSYLYDQISHLREEIEQHVNAVNQQKAEEEALLSRIETMDAARGSLEQRKLIIIRRSPGSHRSPTDSSGRSVVTEDAPGDVPVTPTQRALQYSPAPTSTPNGTAAARPHRDSLENRLDLAQQREKELHGSVLFLREELNKEQRRSEASRAAEAALRQQMAAMKEKYEEEVKRLGKEKSDIYNVLTRRQQEVIEAASETTALRARIARLMKDHAEEGKRSQHLTERLIASASSAEEGRGAAALKAALEEAKRSDAANQQRIKELEEASEGLRSELERQKRLLRGAMEGEEELAQQLDKRRAIELQLQRELSESLGAKAKAESRAASAEKQLEQLHLQTGGHHGERIALEELVRKARKEADDARAGLDAERQRAEQLSVELTEAMERAMDLQVQNERLQNTHEQELAASKKQRDEAHKVQAAAEKRAMAAERELREWKDQYYTEPYERLKQDVTTLEAQLKEANAQIAALKDAETALEKVSDRHVLHTLC